MACSGHSTGRAFASEPDLQTPSRDEPEDRSLTVLVIGADGFVGRHLCQELVRRSIPVRGTVRRGESVLPDGAERFVITGLEDSQGLARAMRGADAVVHLAARVHVMHETSRDPMSAFRATNVLGTRSVCESARRAGVSRLVYVSSTKVHGEGRAAPYVETDEPEPTGPYAVSKVEAERVVRGFGASRPTWTILRPPLIYGEGVGGNFRRLLRMAEIAQHIPLPLGSVRNERAMVYVGNLVDVIIRSLGTPSAQGRTFIVSDDRALSTAALIRSLAMHMGGAARLYPFPVGILRRALAIAGRAAEAQRLLDSLNVDSSAVRRTLEWTPPVPVDEALRRTAAWWKQAARSQR